jgi:hypothetical protein
VVCVVVLVAVVTADDADSKRVCNKPRREIKNEELEIPLENVLSFSCSNEAKCGRFLLSKKELRTTVVLIIIL